MEAPSSAPPRVEARRSPRVAPGATAGVSAHTPRRRARRSAALPQHLLARSDTGRNTSAQRALLGFNPQQIADLWRVLPPALVNTDRPGRASLPRLHGDDSLLHRGCVNAAAWNQSGTLLCTGSDDRRVKIWDAGRDFALAEGGTIKTGHRRNIFHVSFVAAASDRQILSCGADGQLRLSDVTAGSEAEHGRLLCDEGDGMMFMFEWMPRVPVVLTAQEDGTVHRVDLREPRPEQLFANPRGAVKALAFGHHSEHILAAGGDGACVKLYDVRKLGTSASAAQALVCSCVPDGLSRVDAAAHGGRLQMGSAEDSISISGLKWSHDGRDLLASYHGDQIVEFDCWNLDGGGATRSFGGHINYDTFLKTVTYFGPSDEYVLSGSDSGHIFVWERATERLLRVIAADEDACNGIVPHPHLPTFASYGIDSDAKVWSSTLLDSPSMADSRKARADNHMAEVQDTIEHNVVAVISSAANIPSMWRHGSMEQVVYDRDNFLKCCQKARFREPSESETVSSDPYPRYPTDLRGAAAVAPGDEAADGVDAVPAWAAAIEAIIKKGLEGDHLDACASCEKAELYLLELARRTFAREQCMQARAQRAAAEAASAAADAADAADATQPVAECKDHPDDTASARKRQRTGSDDGRGSEGAGLPEAQRSPSPAPTAMVSSTEVAGDEPAGARLSSDDDSDSDGEGGHPWEISSESGSESGSSEDDAAREAEEQELRDLLELHSVGGGPGSAGGGLGDATPIGHILLCGPRRICELLMDQSISREHASEEKEIVDGDTITTLPMAWFTTTPDHVRDRHESSSASGRGEPAPEPAPTADSSSATPVSKPIAPFAVGDSVFIHSLKDDKAHMNGRLGTIVAEKEQKEEADGRQETTEAQYMFEVLAYDIPNKFTSDVAGDLEWFDAKSLSPLIGDASPDGVTLQQAMADQKKRGSDKKSHRTRKLEPWLADIFARNVRVIDKTRTFSRVQGGRAHGGLLPPRPALKDPRAMFLLGFPCDKKGSFGSRDCPVARARLQGETLVNLLRRREYAVVWQAILTLLDSHDHVRLQQANFFSDLAEMGQQVPRGTIAYFPGVGNMRLDVRASEQAVSESESESEEADDD